MSTHPQRKAILRTRARPLDTESEPDTGTQVILVERPLTLGCMEVWGSNQRVTCEFQLPGLAGWINSAPLDPDWGVLACGLETSSHEGMSMKYLQYDKRPEFPIAGVKGTSIACSTRLTNQALLLFCLLLTLSLKVLPATAQEWPQLPYEPTLDVLQLPDGWNLGEVAGVALNGEGHIFVFHRGQHPLLEFDAQGHFIREIGAGLFDNAHGLRIDRAGNLWVADRGAHLVLRLDKGGRVTMVLGMRGRAGEGWFDRDYNVHFLDKPQDVGFDSEGNIYVADRGNARVIKFNADGQVVTTWGTEGSEPGQFNFVHAIVVDSKDRIYVADRENRRIQIFDTNGVFLDEWTHIGYPYGLVITPDDTIWMTDARAERILKLNTDGHVIGHYGGTHGKAVGQFGFLHAIAVAPSGSLYVGEVLNWRLQRLVPKN